MRYKRTNTLALDVSAVPVRPNNRIIQKIVERMGLDPSKLKSVEVHSSKKVIYVGLPDNESAVDVAAKYSIWRVPYNGSKYPVPIIVADEDIVDVRVCDLPLETPSQTITESLQKYGKVLSVTCEVWKDFFPGAFTGVRVARMKVTQNIPSFVSIGNSQALVRYAGQVLTCRRCSQPYHKNSPCNISSNMSATSALENPALSAKQTTQQQKEANQNDDLLQKKINSSFSSSATIDEQAAGETDRMEEEDALGTFTTVKRKKKSSPRRLEPGSNSDSESSSAELGEDKLKKINEEDAYKLGPDNFAKWLALQGGAKNKKKFKK